MVASIAIRVALINISSLPKTDMLIIDEGFNELDDANVDACGQLLRSLTRWFKNIIIITHLNSLKDVVDNIIDITRQDKNANVQYN
jgi:DNA repair exonuclease SbcCD ATPase subunit